MAASVNDKFMKVGAAGTATTLAAPGHSVSGTTITVASTTNWPTDTGVVFAIRQVDSDGVLVPGTYTEWRGTVSGSTITNMTLEYGTDQVYPAGSTTQVYIPVSADRDNRLVDGILVEHDQDGTHGDITPTSINTGAITATSITANSLTLNGSASSEGWSPLGDVPDTVTYNGNRNYDLVFNSNDLSDQLSPGMKLQLTRTVAAPDQCADLEASSSQYFSRASASLTGVTFTDDFTVSAWIKLESYPSSGLYGIVSRWNGTSGFVLRVSAQGRVGLYGYNAGGANYSGVQSYASIPLNKWVHVTAQLDMSAYTATSTTSYVMIDGVDVAVELERGGTNPTALIQAGDLQVGTANTTNYFDGKLAQVAIFNAKVTQATMRTYMSQGLSGSETSLISAYSFDNSITDLNTTNANNLTAQNSAAATNADSPFANAVSAGLLEYAEINSVAFSTNTTVNVRVPDTCMIPTSGGVSAVSYSTQSNPYGLPAFSNIIGYAQISSSFASASTSIVAVNGLSVSVVPPQGRRLKITFGTGIGVSNNTNGGTIQASICVGSVAEANRIRYANSLPSGSYSNADIGDISAIYTPASTPVTFLASMLVGAGSGGINTAATSPAYIMVELV